jgi:hypothetical protein
MEHKAGFSETQFLNLAESEFGNVSNLLVLGNYFFRNLSSMVSSNVEELISVSVLLQCALY